MNPTTQAVLLALLGAVLGGGVVFAWRASDAMLRPREATPVEPGVVPSGVASVLSVLPSSALVVEADDTVVKASAPAYAMGLVQDGALLLDDVVAMVHAVRRDGQIREAELTVGAPALHVWVRVAPLDSRLVLVLAEDRTRERRVEAIRRDFVANVSHELKTPVGAIALLAEGVLDAADDPEAVRRFASMMQAEGDRLAALVSKIIELSRLQDDEMLDDAEAVPVDDLLEQVVEENRVEAEARRISVVREGSPGLSVRGSREQLALAVGNLVANAVTYSPDGSTVVVSATGVDGRVELSVVDQGIGIPADEVDRIFERFYRLDPARQRSTGGTGLGLSIVKHVAASHGGDVRVWSVPGQGSTFTLSLPLVPALDHRDQEVLR
ncbi:MAG TPA: ATP-binding protein [Marmoricola sp.]|nr:ATP-binding protein [Marmoricola sp.]